MLIRRRILGRTIFSLPKFVQTDHLSLQGACIKKTKQIRNRSQRREAAQLTIKFMIKIDCLGTYEVE